MNALLEISFLSLVVCQTANAARLIASMKGVEVWISGTPGEWNIDFRNRNRHEADVDYILDGEEESIAEGRKQVNP
jgi:hypothetical protein